MKVNLIILLVLSVLVSCTKVLEDNTDVVGIGDKIPSFSIVMNNSRILTNSDLTDTTSIICFFNTGCPDCQKELPVMQEIYDEGICELVMISRSESDSSINGYWASNDLTMPYSAQSDDAVYKKFANSIIPRIYVVDRAGTIRFKYDDSDLPSYGQLVDNLCKLL